MSFCWGGVYVCVCVCVCVFRVTKHTSTYLLYLTLFTERGHGRTRALLLYACVRANDHLSLKETKACVQTAYYYYHYYYYYYYYCCCCCCCCCCCKCFAVLKGWQRELTYIRAHFIFLIYCFNLRFNSFVFSHVIRLFYFIFIYLFFFVFFYYI